MLREFLLKYSSEILALAEEKTRTLAGTRMDSDQLKRGLPLFYKQLIKVLEQQLGLQPPKEMVLAAASHGGEFLVLGYSLSHVVHAYGAMCQSITELATIKNSNISPNEFNILNGCLDVAIASAVSEFQFRSNEVNEKREMKHLGFLAHELRNALSSATVAHEMIKAGLVGVGGSTAAVLEGNLVRMRILIDRSLSEVRMRADADLFIEKFKLSDLLDQIVATAELDAKKKNQTLLTDLDWEIEIEADRQYLLSAVANIVHNAIKYTKIGGKIELRSKMVAERIHIEISDQCGGIKTENIALLFEPYTQENADRSGVGLGLTIVSRAIQLSQGFIRVENSPGVGCTFILDLPIRPTPVSSNKSAVPGRDSVQPDFGKKAK